ncbi:DUF1648 domain-containing protein [Nocardioides sp. zg-DK7169]|uniref:DUF1648 domain-containing protein n=1 Tax=Nocardioides sp. zg-DK7169 TaxID=2736600 RepID=UPI001554D4F7|nr:DUF1648 domain-containing protein [Nocardioides sp. zg-DK7169]NPC98471.1 DUF1648 domain-containing protein [Nocardioides sp. zg-DK7169]
MRLAFTLTTAAYVVLLGAAATRLPERVPVHLGFMEHPERWGSRTETVALLGGAGLVLALAVVGAARVLPRQPLSSPWVDVPHHAWWAATPEREAVAQQRMAGGLYGLGAGAMLVMSAVLVSVVVTARAGEPTLGTPFLAAIGGGVGGLIIWSLWMSLFRYRPEEGR